jgi:hypothetical protein
MTKKAVTTPEEPQIPQQVVSPEKARQRLIDLPHDTDPLGVIKKFAKALTDHNNNTGEAKDKAYGEMEKLYPLAVSATSLETHARIGDIGGDKLGPLAIELTRQLITQYKCDTVAEKTLAEVAAAAYIRVLRYSTALNRTYELGKASPELNKFMSVMSVEIDRANRHYLTALNTLKGFKQPSVNVTFNAQTAFVAQHQNVNASPPNIKEEQANAPQ